MLNETTWDGAKVSAQIQDNSVVLSCASAGQQLWVSEVPVYTGQHSFIRGCSLRPAKDRLLVSLGCEDNRGGTACYSQIFCLAADGGLLWGQMVDRQGGEVGLMRLSGGLAVIADWDIPQPMGLHDLEARLLDIDTGQVLKTHTVPVVKDLKKKNWTFNPSVYGSGKVLRFGVRVTATAAPEVPKDWGVPV